MLTESVFLVTCPCGHEIVTHEPKVSCPHCHRQLVIAWPAAEVEKTEVVELRRSA